MCLPTNKYFKNCGNVPSSDGSFKLISTSRTVGMFHPVMGPSTRKPMPQYIKPAKLLHVCVLMWTKTNMWQSTKLCLTSLFCVCAWPRHPTCDVCSRCTWIASSQSWTSPGRTVSQTCKSFKGQSHPALRSWFSKLCSDRGCVIRMANLKVHTQLCYGKLSQGRRNQGRPYSALNNHGRYWL